jgi:hypothetical protein
MQLSADLRSYTNAAFACRWSVNRPVFERLRRDKKPWEVGEGLSIEEDRKLPCMQQLNQGLRLGSYVSYNLPFPGE